MILLIYILGPVFLLLAIYQTAKLSGAQREARRTAAVTKQAIKTYAKDPYRAPELYPDVARPMKAEARAKRALRVQATLWCVAVLLVAGAGYLHSQLVVP